MATPDRLSGEKLYALLEEIQAACGTAVAEWMAYHIAFTEKLLVELQESLNAQKLIAKDVVNLAGRAYTRESGLVGVLRYIKNLADAVVTSTVHSQHTKSFALEVSSSARIVWRYDDPDHEANFMDRDQFGGLWVSPEETKP